MKYRSKVWPAVNVALALLALATAAHLWTPLANPIGLRLQTAVSIAAWRGAAALDGLPGFEAVGDGLVLLRGGACGLILAGLIAAGRSGGPRAWPAHAFALPALLGLGAAVAYGGGLAPTAWILTVALAILAGERTGRRTVDAPARGRVGAGWLGWTAFLLLHALYVSGPGIQPALVADGGVAAIVAALVDPLIGAPELLWGVQLFVAAGAVAASRFAQARGLPLVPRAQWGPAGWLVPAAHLAVLAVITGAPVQVLSVWKCPPPAQSGPIESIDPRPGSFQLHLVDGGRALWSVDREASKTRRWEVPSGRPLPDIDWRARGGEVWPEEQIPVGDGVWTALVDPELFDSSVLRRTDLNGDRAGEDVVTDGCYVASWVALEGGRLLLGCEYDPEFIVLDAATGAIEDRFVVPEAGSFEEIVLGGDGRSVFTVPLWFGASLTEIDLAERRLLSRTLIGDFNWGAARVGDTLVVSRFQEGRLLAVDMATRRVLDAVHVGYGARPVAARPEGRWVIAAGTYSGTLSAASIAPDGTFERVRRLPVGGLVRSLAVSASGDDLYLAGRCGVRRLDLATWLDGGEP